MTKISDLIVIEAAHQLLRTPKFHLVIFPNGIESEIQWKCNFNWCWSPLYSVTYDKHHPHTSEMGIDLKVEQISVYSKNPFLQKHSHFSVSLSLCMFFLATAKSTAANTTATPSTKWYWKCTKSRYASDNTEHRYSTYGKKWQPFTPHLQFNNFNESVFFNDFFSFCPCISRILNSNKLNKIKL